MPLTQEQLQAIEMPPLFRMGFQPMSELYQFSNTDDMLPSGVQITLTGSPGTGKTRLALQMLDAIGAANPELQTEVRSYEMSGPMLGDLIAKLGLSNIDHYICDKELENSRPFNPNTVYLIDSLDFWATHLELKYPDDDMARVLLDAKEAGTTIIAVHHKTKTGRSESGSTIFRKLNDIRIELRKTKTKGIVSVSTESKNRYPGSEQTITLKHTPSGLTVLPPTPLQQFWMRITGLTS